MGAADDARLAQSPHTAIRAKHPRATPSDELVSRLPNVPRTHQAGASPEVMMVTYQRIWFDYDLGDGAYHARRFPHVTQVTGEAGASLAPSARNWVAPHT